MYLEKLKNETKREKLNQGLIGNTKLNALLLAFFLYLSTYSKITQRSHIDLDTQLLQNPL